MTSNSSSQYLRTHFDGKTVLVTGHTGFKGSWLISWLKFLGANIVGIALDPISTPSHFLAGQLSRGIVDLRIDIRDNTSLVKAIIDLQPDYVFHLAAQALVRQSYDDPLTTWETNVLGTMHVMDALRKLVKPCIAVMITSDKCYQNREWIWGYKETDTLGGTDPYSSSKAAAEFAIQSYVKSYFPDNLGKVRIASARAGNVMGGGDWAEDRIIPDCVKSWSKNTEVALRSPNATRPWQHVLEPLSGYLTLAAELSHNPNLHGEAFNFGPYQLKSYSVLDLVEEMSRHWDQVRWKIDLPNSETRREAGLLRLNCEKAMQSLNWHSALDFEETVQITAEWYRNYYSSPQLINETTENQISLYVSSARKQGLKWAH
jgi:CDP-glucose 4,6-dehydratase